MSKSNHHLAAEIGQNVTDVVSRLLGSGPVDGHGVSNAEPTPLPEGKVHHRFLNVTVTEDDTHDFSLDEVPEQDFSGMMVVVYLKPTGRGGPIGRMTPPPMVVFYVPDEVDLTINDGRDTNVYTLVEWFQEEMRIFDENNPLPGFFHSLCAEIDQAKNQYTIGSVSITHQSGISAPQSRET